MINFKLIFFLIIISFNSAAFDTLVFSRSRPHGVEIISFSQVQNKTLFLANSNFIDPYADIAMLGNFELESNDSSTNFGTEIKRVNEISFSAKKSAQREQELGLKKEIAPAPSQISISLNGIQIYQNAPYWNELYQIGQKLLAFGSWKKIDGVIITRDEIKKLTNCTNDITIKQTSCKIDDQGTIYFNSKGGK